MVAIVIDAVLLLGLLKLINNGNRDLMTAIVGAIVVTVGAPMMAFLMLLATGENAGIGDSELFIAVNLAITFLAGVVMLMFGVELKKSFLTAILFSTVRFSLAFGLGSLAVA